MKKYFTDGYTLLSNPSTKGGGFTVIDEDNNLIKNEEILRDCFTNNEAEIRGIHFALKIAKEEDVISTDSMCCISWVRWGKSKARKDLFDLLQECMKLKNEKKINLMWEGREKNLAGIFNESNFSR